MRSRAGDDAHHVDVEAEEGEEEGEAVVGGEPGEDHPRTAVSLGGAVGLREGAVGDEAERLLAPQPLLGLGQPVRGGRHSAACYRVVMGGALASQAGSSAMRPSRCSSATTASTAPGCSAAA